MSFAPLPPTIRAAPQQIAPDTWLIRQVAEAFGQPLFAYLNSVVIAGAQPVIIDTGSPANRDQWLDDAFSIVEPDDVRWVLLSHEDIDHTGNLAEVLTRCPNATLVGSWAITERYTSAFNFPLDRLRWANDGDSLDVGDRTLRAVRPPLYDSPCTRGFLDERTGMYWAADLFACPMPGAPIETAADFDPEFWLQGMAMFAYNGMAPWLGVVDRDRYAALCDRAQSMGATTIAAAHTPVIEEASVEAAFDLLHALPAVPAPPCPDQAALDAILSAAPPPDP